MAGSRPNLGIREYPSPGYSPQTIANQQASPRRDALGELAGEPNKQRDGAADGGTHSRIESRVRTTPRLFGPGMAVRKP